MIKFSQILIKIHSIEELAAQMWKNSHLHTVGPTIENATINLSDKTGRMLNDLEKVHIYIEQIDNQLKAKDQEPKKVNDKFSLIESRFSKLESN